MPAQLVATSRHHASAKRRCVEWERLVRREARRVQSLARRQPVDSPNLRRLLAWEGAARPFDAKRWNDDALVLGVGLMHGEPAEPADQSLARLARLAGAISRGDSRAVEALWSTDAISGEGFEMNALACVLSSLSASGKTAMAIHALGEALTVSGRSRRCLARLFTPLKGAAPSDAPFNFPSKMSETLIRAWFSNREFLEGLLIPRGPVANQGIPASRKIKRLPSLAVYESIQAIAKHAFDNPPLAVWAACQAIERAKALNVELRGVFRLDGDIVKMSLPEVVSRGLQTATRADPDRRARTSELFAHALRERGLDFYPDEIDGQRASSYRGADPFVATMSALRERDELALASEPAPERRGPRL